jgi:L,D-peptidoglycan transpeptidase YkuD (ErfK/YbiS/YcfS/YnhG family)
MRSLLYRPDRGAAPPSRLPARTIGRADGWCDDPDDPAYNRPVALPHAGRAEALWRADELYDLVVPLGYNDDPPRLGAGSAIFLHLARPDYAPTEGCVALARADLLAVLVDADTNSRVVVSAAGAPA